MNKQESLAKIEASHQQISAVINQITPEQAEKPDILGYWSARQILAHITAWQAKAIEIIEGTRSGIEVEQPNDEDAFNAVEVAKRAGLSWSETKAEFERVYRQLAGLVDSLPDDIYALPNVGWFRGSTISHYRIHQPDLEKAL